MKILRGRWIVGFLASASLLVFCGCRGSGQAGRSNEIEVSIFKGGYGEEFFQQVARDYERAHPGAKVNLWADPRNAEKLRPRFIAGNPPDAIYAWMPVWTLVGENQIYPLDRELGKPPYNAASGSWREQFQPGALSAYSDGRHTYAVPLDVAAMGIWYNVRLCRERGWKVPGTWEQFLNLCERAKRTGLDPIAFQGAYANYIGIAFTELLMRIGGPHVWADCMNMEPGAWQNAAVVKAWRLVQDLRRRGYIKKEYMGMSHLEAQREFVLGHAAFVFCGTWLKTEMASSTPPDFEMAFFPIPPVRGAHGDPTAVALTGGFCFVPARASHPEKGADFLRFLCQRRYARRFAQQLHSLLGVRGGEDAVPPELRGAVEAVAQAHFTYPGMIIQTWYPAFSDFMNEAFYQVMNLRWTPEQAAAILERAAGQLRADATVAKHRVDPPGPAAGMSR